GRQFLPEEDAPNAAQVVMLSHGVWQRRYGSDRSIVGRSILVDGKPATVVGVMPPRFQFPERAQLWLPETPITSQNPRAQRELGVYARVKPGISLDAARRDLVGVAAQIAAEHLDNKDRSAVLT